MIIRGVEREDQTLLRVQYSRNLIFRNVLNFSEKSVLTAHMTKYYLPILFFPILEIFSSSPLALSEGPAGDDPERDHEDQEDGAGADGHESLENKPSVEVDPIEGPDTPGAGVGEELAVE